VISKLYKEQLVRNEEINYGIEMEAKGIERFEDFYHTQVSKCGFFISK
jgi:hypothetical protein